MELVGKIAEEMREISTGAKDYPVQLVDDGPVMENRMTGDDVDLTIFPTPLWHEDDGGRFIGTGAVEVHRDPDTGWVNVAPYRVQLQGKNLVSNFIAPGHHGYGIRQKYWDRGQPCPVVMCLGIHPLIHLIGATDVPPQVDEFTWIGALARQRVPVISGPLTGLPIPADAEMAIEGYAYPGEEMSEGPFGEFTGYYAGGERKQPLVQVKAVYYRNQPIMLGMPPSRPPDSVAYYFSVMRAAAIMETLRKAGIPGVKSVWSGEAGGGRMWLVTSIQQQYAGHAEAAAGIAALCQAGGLMCRYSIVVDEDVDPSDNDDVIWALCTRSDPASDIDILRQCWSTQLDPTIPREAKRRQPDLEQPRHHQCLQTLGPLEEQRVPESCGIASGTDQGHQGKVRLAGNRRSRICKHFDGGSGMAEKVNAAAAPAPQKTVHQKSNRMRWIGLVIAIVVGLGCLGLAHPAGPPPKGTSRWPSSCLQ